MSISLGNIIINQIYLGSTSIDKAYLGSTLVYDKTALDIRKTWEAHETGGISEATWADYETGGSNPTTWAELETFVLPVGAEAIQVNGQEIEDEFGNKIAVNI